MLPAAAWAIDAPKLNTMAKAAHPESIESISFFILPLRMTEDNIARNAAQRKTDDTQIEYFSQQKLFSSFCA